MKKRAGSLRRSRLKKKKFMKNDDKNSLRECSAERDIGRGLAVYNKRIVLGVR